MKKIVTLFFMSLTLVAFISTSSVHAKRFGGGGSFGKKSSGSLMSRSASKPKTFKQQQASKQNASRKADLAKKGGLMGMLGGLALGGLLGAMLFGGAFENLNMMDILMFAGIGLMIFMFLKHRKKASFAGAGGGGASPAVAGNNSPNQLFEQQPADNNAPKSGGLNVGLARGNNQSPVNNTVVDDDEEVTILPNDFNQDDFLNGASSAYRQLQDAWSDGNLDQIKSLCTERMFNEIKQEFNHDDIQGVTKIVKLKAEMIDFNERADQTEVSVLFDALLGETDEKGNAERVKQVQEIWHFVQPQNSDGVSWLLDGLEQLDD